MREDDSKWRDWINFAIQGAWKNGTYMRLYHKFFGPAEPPFELEIWQD